jgi:hypothetical protein
MLPMAEADRDPTSPFAIPPPTRVTLVEAVDLIASSGLRPDDVRDALLRGLSDGLLIAGDLRPEYFRNLPHQQLAPIGMPEADLAAIRNFAAIPPISWLRWVDEDGSIIRTTGEVIRHIPGGRGAIHFRPTLSRIDVLAYFMAAKTAAKAAPPPQVTVTYSLATTNSAVSIQPVLPKLKLEPAGDDDIREVLRVVYNGYPDGSGPNINDVVALVKPQLEVRGLEATKEYIQRIADESEFRKKRRTPGKHRE